jgi:hypothetical protein
MRRFLLAALALAALSLPGAAQPAATHPVLVGTVGYHNAYVITLTFPNGRKVHRIPAGTYTLIVHDYSSIHNFALGSQTQNKRLLTTGVAWIGVRRYTLKLVPGSYVYACSVHYQTMNGTFIVT